LLHGVFPSKWKVSNVCPVFKNGDKQNKSNYRPIALLSSVSKCLEKIVFKRLYEHRV
jgi:sarcosine oxidase/L-pipecolate oxidase